MDVHDVTFVMQAEQDALVWLSESQRVWLNFQCFQLFKLPKSCQRPAKDDVEVKSWQLEVEQMKAKII